MNVFHRYTRQALRKNRSRTWVTIVGIILSVALFTALTEGAYSGVQYLIGAAEYTVSVVQWQRPPCAGGHHGAGAGPPDAGWGGADGL